MRVHVEDVSYPGGGSTLAYGVGYTDDGQLVKFVGDWRPMRDMAEDLLSASEDDLPIAEIEDYQLIAVWTPQGEGAE
jgi:hypothetical protein